MADSDGTRFINRYGDPLRFNQWIKVMLEHGIGLRLAESCVPSPLGDVVLRTLWTGIDSPGAGPFVTVRAPLGRFYCVLDTYRTEEGARAGHTRWVVRAAAATTDVPLPDYPLPDDQPGAAG